MDASDLFAGFLMPKSPRLLWLEKHRISTWTKVKATGLTYYANAEGNDYTSIGDTELECLDRIALHLGIKLWH